MRLTRYTDYALRVLMHLAARPERLATIGEMARVHRISQNHLMKVVHDLRKEGYLEAVRGVVPAVFASPAPRRRSSSAPSSGIRRRASISSIAAPA